MSFLSSYVHDETDGAMLSAECLGILMNLRLVITGDGAFIQAVTNPVSGV